MDFTAVATDQVIDRVAVAMLDNSRDVVVDSLSAVSVLACAFSEEDTRCKFAPVATMLLQGVQWRHRPAIVDRLRAVADLVEMRPWIFSGEAVTGLLDGLEQIAKDTSAQVRGNDKDEVIALRAAAASLAFALHRHCQDAGLDEPAAIRIWRERCSDPNEFSEIRNSWMVGAG